MEQVLVNRVAESGIVTFNLEDYYPTEPMIIFDIKDFLFHGLILKEKDFRDALKIHDWSVYQDKLTLIQCSAVLSYLCGHICLLQATSKGWHQMFLSEVSKITFRLIIN
jgi:hypothetical protein